LFRVVGPRGQQLTIVLGFKRFNMDWIRCPLATLVSKNLYKSRV